MKMAAVTLHALPHQPVVLLTSSASADLIRAGARGVLGSGVSELQIGMALQAAAADLVVLSPESTPAPPLHRRRPV